MEDRRLVEADTERGRTDGSQVRWRAVRPPHETEEQQVSSGGPLLHREPPGKGGRQLSERPWVLQALHRWIEGGDRGSVDGEMDKPEYGPMSSRRPLRLVEGDQVSALFDRSGRLRISFADDVPPAAEGVVARRPGGDESDHAARSRAAIIDQFPPLQPGEISNLQQESRPVGRPRKVSADGKHPSEETKPGWQGTPACRGSQEESSHREAEGEGQQERGQPSRRPRGGDEIEVPSREEGVGQDGHRAGIAADIQSAW